MITDLRSFESFVLHEIQICRAWSAMHFGWTWAFNDVNSLWSSVLFVSRLMPACRMMILAVTWQACRILWRNTNLWKPTSLLTRLVQYYRCVSFYDLFWSGFYWRFILGWVWFPIGQPIGVREDRESIASFPALIVGLLSVFPRLLYFDWII